MARQCMISVSSRGLALQRISMHIDDREWAMRKHLMPTGGSARMSFASFAKLWVVSRRTKIG